MKFSTAVFPSLVIAFALTGCNLHQDGRSDVNVSSVLPEASTTGIDRAPASAEASPTPRLDPIQSTKDTAVGQAAAPGGGFNRENARVRDSSNPEASIRSEAEQSAADRRPASQTK